MRFIAGLALLVAASAAFARAGDDAPAPPVAPPVAQYEGKSAAEWTSDLASEDVKLRQKAAYALFKMGPDAKSAASSLVKAIRDADPYVRTTSAKALDKLGPDAVRSAAADLASEMFDERQEVRREAASLLWRLAPLAADVVPELTKALASADEVVRAKAAWCLSNAGAAGKPALEALAKAAGDPVEDVRKGAAHAIATIDPAMAFASDRASVRLAALQAYGDWPKNKEWTYPMIIAGVLKSIDDRDEEVRSWAVHALDTFAAIEGDDPPVEWIPVFRRVLETQRAAGPRAAAAAGLGRYPTHAAEVLPPLIAAMNGREPEVKAAAVQSLGWLGPKAAIAVPGMLECVRHDDPQVRSAACYSLGLIGTSSDAVIGSLLSAIRDEDRWVRRHSIESLGRLGKGSDRVADALVLVIAAPDADPYIAGVAVEAVVAAGVRDRSVAALARAFDGDGSPPSVAFALAALDATAAAKALERLIAMASRGERLSDVLAALRLLGPKAAGSVAAIVPHLSSEDPRTRISAAVALGAIGPGAKDALPALERMSKDPDAMVVTAAKQAIEEIRAASGPTK